MDATDDLFHRALDLTTTERADLAKRLLESLDEKRDDPAKVEEAWARELERRAEDVVSGRARTVPADEVFEQANARFRKS